MAMLLNPYNFIPLSEKAAREPEVEEELFTGKINYTLTTKSPLFIPNTSSEKAFEYTHTYTKNIDGEKKDDDPDNEHKLYDFFSYATLEEGKTYNNEYFQPVIPGSEVRGALRSVYETLTNSCMSVVDENSGIGKRTTENFRTGIIMRENGMHVLYEASDNLYQIKQGERYEKTYKTCTQQDGSRVYVTFHTRESYCKPIIESIQQSQSQEEDLKEGWLIKGMAGPEMEDRKEKHCAHVFFKTVRVVKKKLDEDDMKSLEIVLNQYQEENSEAYKEYRCSYEAYLKGTQEGLPVYYSFIKPHIMLSPACITREVYRNSVKVILNKHGNYNTCNNRNQLCSACQLFGMVNEDLARGSRIRFTDLKPEEEGDYKALFDPITTLDPMGVPHISNTEFYLKKPIDQKGMDVTYWTYDYYICVDKKGKAYTKEYVPEIAGRKVFWHDLSGLKQCESKTKLNRTIRPIRAEVEFCGSLYFDKITKKQLQQLLYILDLGQDNDHAYKMGQGKALGMGSVLLKVKNAELRKLERDAESLKYCIVPYEEKPSFEDCKFDEKVKDLFAFVTSMGTTEQAEVTYPYVNKGDEGFQWFVENKKSRSLQEEVLTDQETKSPNQRIQTRLVQTQEICIQKPKLPLLCSKIQNRTENNNQQWTERTQGDEKSKIKKRSDAIKNETNLKQGELYQAKVVKVDKKSITIKVGNVTGVIDISGKMIFSTDRVGDNLFVVFEKKTKGRPPICVFRKK